MVAAAGNEANSRHHYKGRITDTVDDIEINVEQDMDGFIWNAGHFHLSYLRFLSYHRVVSRIRQGYQCE